MNAKIALLLTLPLIAVQPSLSAQAINKTRPEMMVSSIDSLLKLSPAQREQIARICLQCVEDLKALHPGSSTKQSFEITKRMRQQVREQLNPEQRRLYNRSRQPDGGGCMIPGPDIQLKALDSLVKLNEAQKPLALEIFTRAFNQLVELSEEDNSGARIAIRKKCDQEILGILTPEQRHKNIDRQDK